MMRKSIVAVCWTASAIFLALPIYAQPAEKTEPAEITTGQTVESLISRARAHLKAGAFEEVIATLDQAIKLSPENAEALLMRAESRLALDNPDGASADYSDAIKLDEEIGEAYLGRCRVNFRRHALNGALLDCHRAAGLMPESAEPHFLMGQIYDLKSLAALAEREYGKALAIDSAHKGALEALGQSEQE